MERIKLCDEMTKQAKELTTAGREKIKPKNFAVPEKSSDTGEPKYPIHDTAHARNALARVSAFGTPEEKAKVRAKVHGKYPGIGDSEEKSAALDVVANNLVSMVALGEALAEDDLFGLRKRAMAAATRIMLKNAQESGSFNFSGGGPVGGSPVSLAPRAPLAPEVRTTEPVPTTPSDAAALLAGQEAARQSLQNIVPGAGVTVLPVPAGAAPPPVTPSVIVPKTASEKTASAKFTEVFEETRRRMISALVKLG